MPKGSLVIVGGGGMPPEVTKKFIDLAGGPDANIVVLLTANPEGPADEVGGFFKHAGARRTSSMLPARKLEEVEDPKNLEVAKEGRRDLVQRRPAVARSSWTPTRGRRLTICSMTCCAAAA